MEKIAITDTTAAVRNWPAVQKKPAQVNGKFYIRLTEGYYQTLRRLVSWPLMALFFSVIWLQWNGMPLVLFSFAERRIVLFGQLLSWHDLPLLAGLLVAAATLLFFMAVAWGRVWCGFACPQSIWTWLFIRIEQLTEGNARQQQKQDEQGRNAIQWCRRLLKHLLWLTLALLTALTFTGYFVPARELLSELLTADFSNGAWLWITIMATLTYANAGLVREKICLHACPYSRFQSVMFDADTRTVSYDVLRGEPRASLRNSDSHSGDCVDCRLCVQVCPTGIDIREGLQAACIDCGACIDACDGVMKKLQRAQGLIRFASENQLQQVTSHVLRPRLLGYGLVMLTAATVVGWGFSNTTDLLVEVRRDRHQLFTQRPDDSYCNDYRIKVESFVPGLTEIQLSVAAEGPSVFEILGPDPLNLQDAQASWQNYRVCTADPVSDRMAIEFIFRADGREQRKLSSFISGTRRAISAG